MSTLLTPTGAPSVFGGVGKLEFAPTNAPDDPFPTYVDLTPYLRTEQAPVTITRGRQTELDTIQPSQLTAVLDNTDGRFTFGNTAGAYGANWTPAKKVRYSETIGQRTFVLFTGWIEFPDIDDWQPIGYQEVNLSCTDRLTRLGRGTPFISTLGAQIMGIGRSTLKAYYPLADAAGPDALTPISQPALPLTPVDGFAKFAGLAGLQFATTDGPRGDDVKFPNSTVHLNGLNSVDGALGFNAAFPYVRLTQPVVLSGTDKLALVVWANLADSLAVNDQLAAFFQGAIPALDIRRHNGIGGNWRMSMTFDLVNFLNLDHPANVATQKWTQVAARLSLNPNSQEIWVDGVPAASAVGGAPPASVTYDQLLIATPWVGSLGHVQVYLLPASVDFAAFLAAQRAVGLTGLEYQSTGQRINTILDYAGVPAGDRAVDPGVSYMQAARLAGQSPETALENAVVTDRGRGFAAGDGRYVFHDRVRVLNV